MNDISAKKALALPTLLATATIALAAAISFFTSVDGLRVFGPYVGAWAALTLLSMLLWVFVQVAKLAPTGADQPLRIVAGPLRERVPQAVLAALIFPLFLGGYTWAKCSIPFVVGYKWEHIWADADLALFGSDAWRLLHAWFPAWLAPAWTYFYAVVWGLALGTCGSLIAAFASRRFAATFFTAMMLAWFFGGIIMAYALSAAGPVFAHLADPELTARFLPLRERLTALLGPDDIVMKSQQYLAAGIDRKFALKGGGVSAMPSMHIATATIFVLAARKTRWIAPALLFLLLTFLGSIYLGYHYAVDAPVAAVVALPCWAIARRIYRDSATTSVSSTPEQDSAASAALSATAPAIAD